MAVSLRRPCRCSHARDAHEHYRSGTDCSACDCPRFAGRVEIILRFGHARPVVVTPEAVPYPTGPAVRPTHAKSA